MRMHSYEYGFILNGFTMNGLIAYVLNQQQDMPKNKFTQLS